MRRAAQTKVYDGASRAAGEGQCPGRSAQCRYASSRRPPFSFESPVAGKAREDPAISSGVA